MDGLSSDGTECSTASTDSKVQPSALPRFEWQRFQSLVAAELQEVKESTEDDEADAGICCAVVDAGLARCPVVFATAAFSQIAGCDGEKIVGRGLEALLAISDKAHNHRLNGEELSRLHALFSAPAGPLAPSATPHGHGGQNSALALLLILERKGGVRFWSLLRASRVVFDGRPHVFLVSVALGLPGPEAFEGERPTAEARQRFEALLSEIRASLRAEGVTNSTRGQQAKRIEDVASAWLKEIENEQRAPPLGVPAAREFEQKKVWSSMVRVAEQRLVLDHKSIAWTVADRDVENCPLVHISPQFETFTGYDRNWMLGRNCRFLQPNDRGRNDAFNGEERRRMQEFCKGCFGKMASFILNQKADGSLFWSLVVLEHVYVDGHNYILGANMQLHVYQELLSMMNTWDHRSLGYVTNLRMLIKAREEHLSPMPARSTVNETMISECFSEWSESIRRDLTDFWAGDNFVPPVGAQAVQAFEGSWAPLLEAAKKQIEKTHGIKKAALQGLRDNTADTGVVCAVADPSAPDCPLVFVSRGFERMTGYKWEFALGRNCRFLQLNHRPFNIKINGDEISRMRHFCTEAHAVGASSIHLLLNEKKSGERFWNLLHMTHVEQGGRRYILGIQTALDLPLPGFLTTAGPDLPIVTERDPLVNFCQFLVKLREGLRSMSGQPADEPAVSVTMAEIVGYMNKMVDDYDGDHYVPKKGLNEVQQFEADRKWVKVFSEVAADMKRIFDATERSYAADKQSSTCCTVADPTTKDCALVYISKGFEELTGYRREWALGRNCRFLQPKTRTYNDAYNLPERSRMREFCQLPQKRGRLLSILVNEGREGYPFWNVLLLKHITVQEYPVILGVQSKELFPRPYIFGVQTDVTQHRPLLAELLAGGPEGLNELGRLRDILHAREEKLGTSSLAALVEESLLQWMSTLPVHIAWPRTPVPLCANVKIPQLGVELAWNEQRALEDKLFGALDDGIRHFHLNFSMLSSSQATDLEGRLFTLRLVEALAIFKQMHLHYLRDALVFSLRAKPNQLAGCLEILSFLSSAGFRVSLWLLDVSNATPAEVSEAWPQLDHAVRRRRLVEAAGLFGGGPAEYSAAGGQGLTRPVVQALDMYLDCQLSCRQWVHINKLSQAGVMVMTCMPFGHEGSLLSNSLVKSIAKERSMDPAMLLLKCADGLGYLCVTPYLRSRPKPQTCSLGSDFPFVVNGIRRSFTREYTAAASAASVLQVLRRRYPNQMLDNTRHQQQQFSGCPESPAAGRRSIDRAAVRASRALAAPSTPKTPSTPGSRRSINATPGWTYVPSTSSQQLSPSSSIPVPATSPSAVAAPSSARLARSASPPKTRVRAQSSMTSPARVHATRTSSPQPYDSRLVRKQTPVRLQAPWSCEAPVPVVVLADLDAREAELAQRELMFQRRLQEAEAAQLNLDPRDRSFSSSSSGQDDFCLQSPPSPESMECGQRQETLQPPPLSLSSQGRALQTPPRQGAAPQAQKALQPPPLSLSSQSRALQTPPRQGAASQAQKTPVAAASQQPTTMSMRQLHASAAQPSTASPARHSRVPTASAAPQCTVSPMRWTRTSKTERLPAVSEEVHLGQSSTRKP